MTDTKPFQQATVEAVLRAFQNGRRRRRFLVADEVGLGKTVVAREVIRAMTEGRRKPLVVFYLCSNLSIAAQNRRKLLEVLPASEREAATCRVDRLTLLAVAENRPAESALQLYCLTPDTSIPRRKGHRRDGRQDERALIHGLIERTFPWLFERKGKNLFRRNATVHWRTSVVGQDVNASNGELQEAFRQSVRREFSVAENAKLSSVIDDLEDLEIIAGLRNALAASAIEQLEPDLVIFDEFQRFRDLLETQGDEATDRVLGRLRGEGPGKSPALLLLSATPFRLYARRAEDAAGDAHAEEFGDLVEFLYGQTPEAREMRGSCESAFEALEAELRKREPHSDAAITARRTIEEILHPIMARTERASHASGWVESPTQHLAAPLQPEDLLVFKHMSASFRDDHRALAVPYWTSIPWPMQTMGPHYVAWDAAHHHDGHDVPRLEEATRDQLQPVATWPHPRLRALRALTPPKRMLVPWVRPSLPWWELLGEWKSEATRPSKTLVFSRFRAVPQSVASSLSFDLEAEFLAEGKITYEDVTKRRLLHATVKRHALLALFHPATFLVRETEPLDAPDRSLAEAKKLIREQVTELLRRHGIPTSRSAHRLPLWKVIARIEGLRGTWTEYVGEAWREIAAEASGEENSDTGLGQLIADWEEQAATPLEAIHPATLETLVVHALSAPGVVVGRALLRHWPGAVGKNGFARTLDATWTGLRNYLDQRWFHAGLGKRREAYPDAIQRLILEGNLEAVLDEHLWITKKLRSLGNADLADELRDGFKLKSGLFFIHPLGKKDAERFSLRCHVAVPFVEARVAYEGGQDRTEGRLRTDDIRRAFNTPFWPYVLATTSVGQEGLDFHAWCDTIVHWDLCRNPVDLEQREGRIQRFGGLAIRRAIVERLDSKIWHRRWRSESPWATVARLAEEQLADESGLAPWWVFEGGGIKRYVFDVPASEQRHWLGWVKQQRLLYRLALGQPNQEDLVEVLAERGVSPEDARAAAINLSPWFRSRPA